MLGTIDCTIPASAQEGQHPCLACLANGDPRKRACALRRLTRDGHFIAPPEGATTTPTAS